MGVIAAMASRKLEEEDEEEIPAGGATGGRLELISSFLSVGHRAHKMLLLSLPSLLPSVCFLLRSRCFLDDCGDSAAIFLRRKTIALLLKSAAVLEDEEVRTQLKSLLPSSAARVSSSCPLLDRRVQLNSRCLSLLLLLRVTRMDLAKTQEEPLNGSTRLLSSLQHLEWILQSENNEDRDGKEEQEQGQEQEQSTNRRPQKRQKSSQDTKGSRASSSFLLQKIISVLLDADDCLIDGLLDLLEIHRRGLELLSSQKLQGGNKELLDQISPQQILDSLTSLWSGDSSFIIELLLSPDTNALEFLVVLLRQLDLQHTSSPSSSSSSSSGDRKLLLQDLRTRLQGAWSKGTFPFNVQPLLRRLDRVLL
uniref:Uncharacterized protein n=1 Tax=Guillardia theta TaxID=55529 RepID=A0A7S4JSK6_GUITH